MGRRSREHKKAVIAGTESPFRASPGKPKKEPSPPEKVETAVKELSKADELLERVRKLKGG